MFFLAPSRRLPHGHDQTPGEDIYFSPSILRVCFWSNFHHSCCYADPFFPQNIELRQPQLDFECLIFVNFSPSLLLLLSFFPQNLEFPQSQLNFYFLFFVNFWTFSLTFLFSFFSKIRVTRARVGKAPNKPSVLQAVLVKIVTEILFWQCAFGEAMKQPSWQQITGSF